ncbi:hypothetical protein, partial [Burkholderia territorii]|uniref:hypothetical protein n=1 Tax=Burkholderia territorii TaxID=1503055 RepID=UPI001593F9D6
MTANTLSGGADQQDAAPKSEATYQDSLLDCVSWLCEHYGFGKSRDAMTAGLPKFGFLAPTMVIDALANA